MLLVKIIISFAVRVFIDNNYRVASALYYIHIIIIILNPRTGRNVIIITRSVVGERGSLYNIIIFSTYYTGTVGKKYNNNNNNTIL